MMKRFFIALAFMAFFFNTSSKAQNVTITPNGITPAPSGDLPRLTYEEILDLPSPSVGDMAIDLTYKTLRFFNGKDWVYFLSSSNEETPILTGFGFKGDSVEVNTSMAFDSQGNIILGGLFNGTLLGAGDTIHVSSSLAPNYSSYLMKVSSAGEIVFTRAFEGTSTLLGLVVSESDDIFITGSFVSSVIFSPSITVNSAGNTDMFVAKFNSSGGAEWVKTAGGTNIDNGSFIRIDDSGDVVVAGEYRSNPATFGPLTLNPNGNVDAYIARYRNSDGKVTLLKSLGGVANEFVEGFEIKSDGNYVLAGRHYGTIGIGADSYNTDGHMSHFIATLNPVSNDWVDSFVLKTGETSFGFTLDSLDNYLITGVFKDSLIHNVGNMVSEDFVGEEWFFVVKQDAASHARVWLHTFECQGKLSGPKIRVEQNSQDTYVSAVFFNIGESVEFYDGKLRGKGPGNSFLAKFSNGGHFQWSRLISKGIDQLFSLEDYDGFMYGTGVFVNDFYLDNIYLEPTNIEVLDINENYSQYDNFVFKIQD